MKINSIQLRFLLTVIVAVLVVAVFIGGLSLYEVDRFVQAQTADYIHTASQKETAQINASFNDMEKSVHIIESYTLGLIDSREDAEDRDRQVEIMRDVNEMFAFVAKHTGGAVSYYIRFDPAISDGTTGLFYSKVDGSEEYIRFDPTDISLYDKDDTEHVGWFWQPYEAGEPVWMQPYYNQNNHVRMISYVVPLYCEGQFIGVVGMDFDYTVLTDRVNRIRIYEHGTAHLEMDGAVIYRGDHEAGTDALDQMENYMQVPGELANGMTIVISAKYNDIRQIRHDIVTKILVAVLLFALLFSVIVVLFLRKIVEPLKKLTEASEKLSDGNYDVEVDHGGTYEIKILSAAFETL